VNLRYRVQQVHEKWVNIRTLLQTKLINILNIHTNPDFKFLAECTEWVHQKLVSFRNPTNPLYICLFSVDRVHERWVGARVRLQRRLQLPLASRDTTDFAVKETTVTKSTKTVIEMRRTDTNEHFRFLEEAILWVSMQLVSASKRIRQTHPS
jgi:hypothetical protein